MEFARLRHVLLAGLAVARLGWAQLEASVHGAQIVKSSTPTPSIGYIVFPGFTPLDVFGPLEILFALSSTHNMTLSTISFSTGAVSARAPVPFTIDVGDNTTTPIDPKFSINPQIVATHDFSTAPPLDILIVPGGAGDFVLDNQHNFTMEAFIASRFAAAQYVLSVCTGATTLARAGVLAGRRATTNKSVWKWATASRHAENVTWVPSARWVEDGKVWTSSGVAAGMDMMYAFAGHYWGWEAANATVNAIEYTPHTDKHWDAFAVVHDVPGVDRNESLTDCVRPVGW
ncbi:class I glutamine amidotransferase-like protein [Karstenula rhodostoma CBS 690.94]|uniref:Class I glutamine amidotransferase-like protein n=1 Tax=Karstenula rhodostoma CBS 690.94 TaxID=1392251 RepID=A0A9P4U6E2_9PLEO|nr:class I glutamine amidotransferase-like protein [Karstenula rhodostoma CBS 690.94]